MNMLMHAKCRTHKYVQEVGGRYCACCDVAPGFNVFARRTTKRSERQAWKREVRKETS